jgi:recombination protein RecT
MSNLPAVMESMNKANDALLTLAENPKKLEQTKLLFLSAIKANEKLAKCTPESLIACLRDVTQYNLDLTKNSVNLVPYGGKATLILGYKGYEQIAMRCGSKGIKRDVVFEDDEFEIDLAAGVIVKHKPGNDRSKFKAVYAHTSMENGENYAVYLSEKQIGKKRSQSQSDSYWGEKGYEGMALKTAVIRLCKQLPNFNHDLISGEYQDKKAVRIEDNQEIIEAETAELGLE